MKKAAIITFHASHNYGSVLQAYALQQTVSKLGVECEIINFRTERQRDLYNVFTKRRGAKYVLKNVSHLLYYRPLCRKYNKFEDFINNRLILTRDCYGNLKELENAQFKYDYYIAGSDQIWNPVPVDFDWAYYLPFVKSGKKISYAPSFGQLSSVGDVKTQERIIQCLYSFDAISVREEGSQKNINKLIHKKADIVLDPTLLISSDEWNKLIKKERRVKEDYIFLYTLFATSDILEIAKTFSKKLNMPVVISNFSNQYDVFTPLRKQFDCGPEDFLNLVKNARLVLSSSFHGTVFSVKFNTPFYAIGGNTDARISTLLKTTGLENRIVDIDSLESKISNAFDVSFTNAEIKLNRAIDTSMNYLRKALDIENGNMQS